MSERVWFYGDSDLYFAEYGDIGSPPRTETVVVPDGTIARWRKAERAWRQAQGEMRWHVVRSPHAPPRTEAQVRASVGGCQ